MAEKMKRTRVAAIVSMVVCVGCATSPPQGIPSAQQEKAGYPDNEQAVFVHGAVPRPGRIIFAQGMSLARALTEAGGFSWARGIHVTRGGAIVYDLGPNEFRDEGKLTTFILQPRDIVFVKRME